MYDVKNLDESDEKNDGLRSDCIGDRAYFRQIQYESLFSLKSIHVPIENIIK